MYLLKTSFNINTWKFDDMILKTPTVPWQLKQELINVLYVIVCRGVQSPTWKNTVLPKEPIPTWNDITQVPAKLSDLPKIKFPVHSHLEYILQKVFKMTGVKLTICRISLIGIYWYQSSNRFINHYMFMHSYKSGLTIDLMIRTYSRNLGQHSKLGREERHFLKKGTKNVTPTPSPSTQSLS